MFSRNESQFKLYVLRSAKSTKKYIYIIAYVILSISVPDLAVNVACDPYSNRLRALCNRFGLIVRDYLLDGHEHRINIDRIATYHWSCY